MSMKSSFKQIWSDFLYQNDQDPSLPILNIDECVRGEYVFPPGFLLTIRYQQVCQVWRNFEHVRGQLYLKIVLEYKIQFSKYLLESPMTACWYFPIIKANTYKGGISVNFCRIS